ncbi:hypothetical protein GGF32_006934, partial [Allomyces javanicus]
RDGSLDDHVGAKMAGHVKYCKDLFMVITSHPDFAHESGSIFRDDGALLCPGRVSKAVESVPESLQGMAIQIAEDGPYVRVWKYCGTWIVSSQKQIHCDQWLMDVMYRMTATQDRDELSALFDDKLDPGFIYGFILTSRDLSCVVQYETDQLKLVSKIDRGTMDETLVFDSNGRTSSTPELGVFPEFVPAKMESIVQDSQGPVQCRGWIFHDYSAKVIYKLDSAQFSRVAKIAKYQDMFVNYVVATNEERKVLALQYPHIDFVAMDRRLASVMRTIMNMYYDSFQDHRYKVPRGCIALSILKRLHRIHLNEGRWPLPPVVEGCLRTSSLWYIQDLADWNDAYMKTGRLF